MQPGFRSVWARPQARGTQSYRRFIGLLIVSVRQVAPVVLRPIFAVCAVWMASDQAPLATYSAICAIAVLVGLVPRMSVLFWLVMVGLEPSGTLPELVSVATGSAILLLGTGYFSAYQPEERWFFSRHGVQIGEPPVAVHTTKRY